MAAVDISPRYEDLCRLCAAKTTVMMGLNIYEEEGSIRHVEKKIETCFPFQINRSDELPKMICEHCLYKLELFYEFRERAVRTQSLLIEIYKEINTNKVQNTQRSIDLVGMNHSDFMVHQQQLLTEHNQLDLHLEHRANIIVNSEMVLGQHSVDIDTHSLDTLNLQHHDISNHSLEAQEILAEAGSQNTQYSETEIDILPPHNQILKELHEELQSDVADNGALTDDSQEASSEIEIKNGSIEHLSETMNCGKKSEEPHSSYCSENVKQEENSNELFSGRNQKEQHTPTTQNDSVNDDWYFYEGSVNKCNICSENFFNSEALAQHLKTHFESDNKSLIAKIHTDANASDSNDGDKIGRDETGEGGAEVGKRKKWSPKVCKECGKTFKNNYKLTEHMRKHTGEKPYKCSSCDKAFRSKIGLAQHEAKHTGQYDFACSTCGKGFQCKSYLMVHQRVHSDVKPYPCTTCGRNFKTKQSLLDHTNRHLGVKPYVCEICGRGFITKGLCKAHQKVHTGTDNRKYSCKVCNKMFVSKSYLQTHLRIHTGEKPFMCEVCGKGFLTRVDLRIHSTMHTGEKSYVCEICGKAFARRDALHCHRRSHTGERPYSCDLCGQTFTQFSPMAIHKRLHTGERPYPCTVCGKKFVSKSTMMSHCKKHAR